MREGMSQAPSGIRASRSTSPTGSTALPSDCSSSARRSRDILGGASIRRNGERTRRTPRRAAPWSRSSRTGRSGPHPRSRPRRGRPDTTARPRGVEQPVVMARVRAAQVVPGRCRGKVSSVSVSRRASLRPVRAPARRRLPAGVEGVALAGCRAGPAGAAPEARTSSPGRHRTAVQWMTGIGSPAACRETKPVANSRTRSRDARRRGPPSRRLRRRVAFSLQRPGLGPSTIRPGDPVRSAERLVAPIVAGVPDHRAGREVGIDGRREPHRGAARRSGDGAPGAPCRNRR